MLAALLSLTALWSFPELCIQLKIVRLHSSCSLETLKASGCVVTLALVSVQSDKQLDSAATHVFPFMIVWPNKPACDATLALYQAFRQYQKLQTPVIL